VPQVPYQPVSTAEPIVSGEKIQIQTPGAAFGENVGAALRQLGTTTDQVGNELFGRAMALQDLRNETDAREAQSKYAEQASLLHAQYGALEGKAAADGLPAYIKAQNDLRNQIRGTLTTAYAQRFYDRDTLPFMQRNVFSAAGHAADQNKRFVVGTAEANLDLDARTYADPTSDAEFQQKIDNIKRDVPTISGALGEGEAQEADRVFKRISNAWVGRIGNIAHENPQAALTMLDQHKTEMSQEDYERVLSVARAQNRAVGGVNLANDVYSPDKSATQMENEIVEKSRALSHGDPLFGKDALSALHNKIANDRYFAKQDQDASMQKIYDTINSGNVHDIRELRLQPGMAQTIDGLQPKVQSMIPGLITRLNESRNKKENEENFTTLLGMSYNDPEAFLDADPTKWNLSNSQINRLIVRRGAMIKDPKGDPMYNQALSAIRSGRPAEMRALGIFYAPTRGEDPESQRVKDYDHFTGALMGAVDAWRQDNGKPPSREDIINKIAPTILRVRHEPGMFGLYGGPFGANRPFFDQDMETVRAWAEANPKMMDRIRSSTEGEPTDEQLYRGYLQDQFIKLYSKEKLDGGPAVPQSK
jgi:hypothetical protein